METKVTLGTFRPNSEMNSEVSSTLLSGRISYGSKSAWFERVFADSHRCDYAVLSNSGTSSLLVALQALKIAHEWADGSEVIVPALTFVASVNAILHAGLQPVLVDVGRRTYNINHNYIAEAITDKTVAIMPVHMFGRPCVMSSIMAIAESYNLRVIEDCCEAFGAAWEQRPVGSFGDVGCFSTYVGHHIVAGIGGMSLTDDRYLADLMRSLVNHGINIDGLPVGKDYDPGHLGRKFVFDLIGHSFRMTELEATIGLYQMRNWKEKIEARIRNARRYDSALESISDYVDLPNELNPDVKHSYMVYPIVCRREPAAGIIEHLRSKGIECRTMMPLTNQPCYDFDSSKWPVAQFINYHGFYIGCHEDLTIDEIDYAAGWIKEYFYRKDVSYFTE